MASYWCTWTTCCSWGTEQVKAVFLWHGAETVQARRVPESNGLLGGDAEVPWCSRSGSIHYIGEDEEPSLRRWWESYYGPVQDTS